MSFNDVLEAVDKLSPSEQEELVQVVYRRNIERRRSQIAEDAREARQEFQAGRYKAAQCPRLSTRSSHEKGTAPFKPFIRAAQRLRKKKPRLNPAWIRQTTPSCSD